MATYCNFKNAAKQFYHSTCKGLEPKLRETVQRQFQEQFRLQQESKASVVVLGPPGSGKSSLINCIFAFPASVAALRGDGKPITKDFHAYESAEKSVVIYDSPGIELGAELGKKFDQFLEENRSKIHCVWVVLNAAQSRVESFWEDQIRKLNELKIPFIFVLNKSDLVSEATLQTLKDTIASMGVEATSHIQNTVAIEEVRKRKTKGKEIEIPTEPEGLEELIEKTMTLLPKARVNAFVGGQTLSIQHKQLQAERLLDFSGHDEVPFEIFFKRLADLAQIWGVDCSNEELDMNFSVSDRLSIGTELWTKQLSSLAKTGFSTLAGSILSMILSVPVLALSPLLVPISIAFSLGKASMHFKTAAQLLGTMNRVFKDTWLSSLHPSRIASLIAQGHALVTREDYQILSPEILAELLRIKNLNLHVEIDSEELQGWHIQPTNSQNVIYKGKWKDTPVAIKKAFRLDEESVQRELALLTILSHPHLVPFLGACTKDISYVYLVTKWMDKGNLQDVLDQEQPNQQVKLRIAREVASAICYLHSLNIIHRDIKPLNILLDENMTAYLCDLGCARDDKLLGTPMFLAPEVSFGNYNLSADVYSFGLVLWSLFSSLTKNTKKPYNSFLFSSEDNQRVAHIVKDCLHTDPNKRPKATQVLKLLETLE